jgi:hypothetical protein
VIITKHPHSQIECEEGKVDWSLRMVGSLASAL